MREGAGGVVWDGLMHTLDWFHTVLDAVGGGHLVQNVPFQAGDGMSVWDALSTSPLSPRNWIIYEAHGQEEPAIHGDGILVGDMKLVRVHLSFYNWPVPPGQDPSAIDYTIRCGAPPASPPRCGKSYCLFNVAADPCKHTDVSAQHPRIVVELKAKLAPFKKQAVPKVTDRGCKPRMDDVGAWERCG